MSDPVDNFRQAIERDIWANSNLSTDERAEVLREYVEALEAEESRFDSTEEHIRTMLRDFGIEPPEDGHE